MSGRGMSGRRLQHALREERGSATPLIVVYAMIALAAILLLFAAADLHLARKQLFTVADGAALAAVTRYDLDAVRVEHGAPVIRLDPEQAALAAQQHLDAAGHDFRITGLRIDGDRVVVRLAGEWRPPVASAFVPGAVPLEVEASARAMLE